MIRGPARRDDSTPRRVGAYHVLDIIGRGAAATVHLATQDTLDRAVALKQLTPGPLAGDQAFAQRFVKEAKLVGRLSHPNVVTVFDYFEIDGSAYIVMEYLGRGSLRPFVGLLSTTHVIGVLDCVLAGLEYAERKGVVHRDLKPENLLVTDDGAVKIADFGIARSFEHAQSHALTATGSLLGTLHYMAPEQVSGGELGPHSDLYSLGIVAWELLAGRLPVDEDIDLRALLYSRAHADVPSLATARPDLDARLVAWVAGLLAREPRSRTASPARAWEQLDEIAVGLVGPHWRRHARLPDEPQDAVDEPAPVVSVAAPQPKGHTQTIAPRARAGPSTAAAPALQAADPAGASGTTDGGFGVDSRTRLTRVLAAALVTGAAGGGLAVGLRDRSDPAPAASAGARPAATAARGAYLAAAAGELRTLAASRAAGVRTMAATRSRSSQARAAARVADAYTTAAQALRRLSASTASAPTAAALSARLVQTAREYDALGRAAATGRANTYRASSSAIARDERALDALVERLGIVVDRSTAG